MNEIFEKNKRRMENQKMIWRKMKEEWKKKRTKEEWRKNKQKFKRKYALPS